jgi:F-type H+-transporting ATPase subunit b
MPQLDVASYAPQLVWLAISFVILYLLMAKVALPRIAGVLEERSKRREDNLARAEEHERDAAAAAQAYEAALTEARSRAQAELGKAQETAKARADAELARVDATLQSRVREAEDAIAQARTAALADAAGIAAEIARLAAHKLAGLSIDEAAARSAADAATRARA